MESELEKVAWFQYFSLLLIKKKAKLYKQQKIGGFEYFGDSDVVNKSLSDILGIAWTSHEKTSDLQKPFNW